MTYDLTNFRPMILKPWSEIFCSLSGISVWRRSRPAVTKGSICVTRGAENIIGQVKHYLKTGLDGLLRDLKKEARKLGALSPESFANRKWHILQRIIRFGFQLGWGEERFSAASVRA